MKKWIIFTVISIISAYALFKIIDAINFTHRIDKNFDNGYLQFFHRDSIYMVDTSYSFSRVSKSGIYNYYNVNKKFQVVIWEINKIDIQSIDSIKINIPENVKNTKIKKGEIFSPELNKPVTVRANYNFLNGMVIIPDISSEIIEMIDYECYTGFAGKINHILLKDEQNVPMIIFEYKPPFDNVMFLVYHFNKKYMLISVNSEYEFGSELLKLFNFAC